MFYDYPGLYRKDTCLSESGKVILDETERRIRVGSWKTDLLTSLRFFHSCMMIFIIESHDYFLIIKNTSPHYVSVHVLWYYAHYLKSI